jgi:serine/threonine-protein kinase RsbT
LTEGEVVVEIDSDADLVTARAEARALASNLGFSRTDATLIATAISEIARNIVVHVGRGRITMSHVRDGRRHGFIAVATDDGPGIRDLETALAAGNASRGGLGLGLPGARRLMDEFEVVCGSERGTTVTMRKWRILDELELLRQKRREVERSRSDSQ